MPTATAAAPPPSAAACDPFAESDLPALDQADRPPARLHWVSSRTGRLLCPSLGLVADCLTGRITESRLVRVFGDAPEEAEDGGVLCASSDRRAADYGRPGRQCAGCEERHASCTLRWRIVWEGCGNEEPGTGLAFEPIAFAHTLSAAGTIQFTRYSLALRREGLRLREVLTRISAEGLHRAGAEKPRWRLRFEKFDPANKQPMTLQPSYSAYVLQQGHRDDGQEK